MPSTTKHRVLGTRLYRKLGVNWHILWLCGMGSQTPNLPLGETYDSMASHAHQQGISAATVWWGGGDHPSLMPFGEPRPGEFLWGGPDLVTRNGNGDITSTTYTSAQVAPATSNMKVLLDACYAHNIGVLIKLEQNAYVNGSWDYHAYKLNRLNGAGNVDGGGAPGWLAGSGDFWTDADAITAFKNRVDAWLNSFGDHEAVRVISLGNELMFTGAYEDFQDWVEEMTTYIWSQYGAHKPWLAVESANNTWGSAKNDAFGRLCGDRRTIIWHNYNTHYTLQDIQDFVYDMVDTYDFYSPASPGYTGDVRKFRLRIGENWGFGAGPDPVPDVITDINIQGDPVTHTLAYKLPAPDDTVAPYPHERMYAFLAMALDSTMQYLRWPQYLDGSVTFPGTWKRCAEILRVAKDFYDTAVFHDTDMDRHTVTSDGVLDFEAALRLENICVTFVLVGAGVQTLDFGVTGAWKIVTYKWEGDGADDWQRVLDEANVPDASSYALNFGAYTDGFCPGYLIKDVAYRVPVRTTITTEVIVQVN